MLPRPTTLTIPSIHDDTVLDCRIYIPPKLVVNILSDNLKWRKKSAVIAHPYAPLGGCYDDPIVDIVASALLDNGFCVGTFNFRGAGDSKGRTSWTSKPETDDYTSFVGLMLYFMHYLSIVESQYSETSSVWDGDEPYSLSPIPSQALPPQSPISPKSFKHTIFTSMEMARPQSLLLLAGYSYGSFITSQLPNLSSIVSLFHAPKPGTAASEIILRARQLAKQQNEVFVCTLDGLRKKQTKPATSAVSKPSRGHSIQDESIISPRKASATASVRLGGEESDPDLRRASHDSHNRKSLSFEPEKLRKSLDRVRSLARPRPDFHSLDTLQRRKSSNSPRPGSSGVESPCEKTLSPLDTAPERPEHAETGVDSVVLDDIKVSYLLISPLQGIVKKLATMWSRTGKPKLNHPSSENEDEVYDLEKKLILNDTLAIFGDEDIFSAIKKLRLWAARLGNEIDSHFNHVEIRGAGHFWHEDGVADQMWARAVEFISGL